MNVRCSVVRVLALSAALASPGLAAESAKDVRVVNAPQEPIPVTASGTVGLAPGTAVGLAAGTQVQVANTAANPVHVMVPAEARQLYMQSADVRWGDGGSTHSFEEITVPAGKRFVIEYIGAQLFGPGWHDPEGVQFTIRTFANGTTSTASFSYPAQLSRLDQPSYSFAERVQLYQDGDSWNMRVGGIRQTSDGPLGGNFYVSGYLIDLP
jgi:hypothetical protein